MANQNPSTQSVKLPSGQGTEDTISAGIQAALNNIFNGGTLQNFKLMIDNGNGNSPFMKSITGSIVNGISSDVTLKAIARNTEIAANMSVAMAGLLYGYKNTRGDTNIKTLLGKITSNQPITDMFDDINGTKTPIFNTDNALMGTGKRLELFISTEGMDKDAIIALGSLLNGASLKDYGEVDVENFLEFIQSLSFLSELNDIDMDLSWVDGIDMEKIGKAVAFTGAIGQMVQNLSQDFLRYFILEKFGGVYVGAINTIEKIVSKMNETLEISSSTNFVEFEKLMTFMINLDYLMKVIGRIKKTEKVVDWFNKSGKDICINFFKSVDELSEIVGDKKAANRHKNSMSGLKNIAILIIGSSLVILLAALVGGYVISNWANILGFTVALAVFMALMITAVGVGLMLMDKMKIGRRPKEVLSTLAPFTMLVIGSALALVIGSLAMDYINVGNLILFTIVLVSFMWGVISPFLMMKAWGQMAMKSAGEFGKLIALSVLSLLVPALVLKFVPDLYGNIVAFGITLIVFIGLVSAAYMGVAKLTGGGGSAMRQAKQFGILVAISAATMLIGGLMFYLLGDEFKYSVWSFAGTLVVFTALMVGAIFGLSKLGIGTLVKATLVMIGIGVIALISAFAFMKINELFEKYSFGTTMENIVAMAACIGVMGLFIAVVGALAMIPGAIVLLGVGAGVVVAVSGVILVMASAIKSMNEALKDSNNIKSMASKMDDMKLFYEKASQMVKNIDLSSSVMQNAEKLDLFASQLNNIVGNAMSVIKNLSNMTYYDPITKTYQKIDNNDIPQLSTNLKVIICDVISAFSSAYKEAKQKCEGEWEDVEEFAEAFGKLSSIIPNLVKGLSDASNMRVVVGYDNNNNPMWEPLATANDLENLKRNLEFIITKPIEIITSIFKNKDVYRFNTISKGLVSLSSALLNLGEAYPKISNIRPNNAMFEGMVGEKGFITMLTTMIEKFDDVESGWMGQLVGNRGLRKWGYLIKDFMESIKPAMENAASISQLNFSSSNKFENIEQIFKSLVNSMIAINRLGYYDVNDGLKKFLDSSHVYKQIINEYNGLSINETSLMKLMSKDELDRFEKQVKSVKNFVTEVNSVNPIGRKLDPIIEVLEQLDKISRQLELDKLVDLLNDKLSSTLKSLAVEMDKSSSAIQMATSTEDKRIERTKVLIDELRNIMTNTLKVNVGNEESALNQQYNGGNITIQMPQQGASQQPAMPSSGSGELSIGDAGAQNQNPADLSTPEVQNSNDNSSLLEDLKSWAMGLFSSDEAKDTAKK